jgi:hypothetical protein
MESGVPSRAEGAFYEMFESDAGWGDDKPELVLRYRDIALCVSDLTEEDRGDI